MEESPISIQIMSPDGRTIKVNRAWEELWGISLEDLSDYNILQDEQLKSLGTIPYIEKGFSGEAASIPAVKYEVQQTIETAKHTRWVEAHIYPAKDDDGNIRAVILMHENITERKQAEEDRERLHQQIVEAQQQTLRELSTPIIPLIEGIIVMPLIGSISTMRAKEIMRMVMAGISKHQAKVVIIDITGIDIVDSGVARHLTKTIQAARLKGAQTIITGVSDGVAEAIVDLGIDWSEIKTLRNLQTGLVAALASQGFKLSR